MSMYSRASIRRACAAARPTSTARTRLRALRVAHATGLPMFASAKPVPEKMSRVGLISDTHGLLRPEAKAFLEGCDRIIHGGDIGNPDILEQLAALAPLTVVRGNNDHGDWAEDLAETQRVQVGKVVI